MSRTAASATPAVVRDPGPEESRLRRAPCADDKAVILAATRGIGRAKWYYGRAPRVLHTRPGGDPSRTAHTPVSAQASSTVRDRTLGLGILGVTTPPSRLACESATTLPQRPARPTRRLALPHGKIAVIATAATANDDRVTIRGAAP